MEYKLKVEIGVEGTSINTFTSFTLHQSFNDHHRFELHVNQDQMETQGSLSIHNSRSLIGKSITVEFGALHAHENQFLGIITKVEIAQGHGLMGDIIISGHSPTIMMDRGADLGAFLDNDLNTIVQRVTAGIIDNNLQLKIKPENRKVIDYIIQYQESDFNFINRLSAQYHEWFYYNGRELLFGRPDNLLENKLVYGRDLSNIQYGIQLAPIKFNKFSYQQGENELISARSDGTGKGTPDLSQAIAASNMIFSETHHQPLSTRVTDRNDIDQAIKKEQAAAVAELLQVECKGDNPKVSIGSIVDIQRSVRKGLDFGIEDFGKFLVTSISHYIDDVGHYHHTFQAVDAETEYIAVKTVQYPKAEMQIATVTANNDPAGQGRVKVQFKWTCDCNDVSEWLRVLTPDAGSSGKVSTNRGFVFIPEAGDQVMVAFEEGNIGRPVVMGSYFHGQISAGGGNDNNKKSITTRTGHTIELNDGGSGTHIIIRDPSGNEILLDTLGKNITITSPETITLNAKNIVMNADQNITAVAGQNVNTSAGATISAAAGSDITNTAVKDFTMLANNIIGTAEDNVTHNATNSITKRAKIIDAMATLDDFKIFSSKKVVNTSGEKGRLF